MIMSRYQKDKVKIVSWANGTDAEIVAMVEAADKGLIDLTDYWNVGDERNVLISEISGTVGAYMNEYHASQTITFVLMDTDRFELSIPTNPNKTKCSFVVGMKNCLKEPGDLSSDYTSSWSECSDRRNWIDTSFRNSISSSIVSIFKKHKYHIVDSSNGYSSEYSNYFTVPSIGQLTGKTHLTTSGKEDWRNQYEVGENGTVDETEGEFKQFTYYKTNGYAKKLGNDSSENVRYYSKTELNAIVSNNFFIVSNDGENLAATLPVRNVSPQHDFDVGLTFYGVI